MAKTFQIKAAFPFFPKKSRERILNGLDEVFESGRLILGKYTEEFEKRFAKYVGTKYAVGVNSCTTALQISLRFFGISGMQAIVPTNTFIATPNSVIMEGGNPKLVDIDKKSLCISMNEVKKNHSKKTGGIIAVHLGGLICPDINELIEFCKKKNIFLIEDAAHAHGAEFNGKKAGALSDAGCFSFYPTKVMTTGTGGMISTNNEKLAEFAKTLRHHGGGKNLESISFFGNDWLLTEIEAVIGLEQLRNLDKMVSTRNKIAKIYRKELECVREIECPPNFEGMRNAYYKFPVILGKEFSKKTGRLKLIYSMKKNHGIEVSSLYFPPCHLQPLYKKRFGIQKFPAADDVLPKQICLPMHAGLKKKNATYVADSLKEELKK